MTLSQLRRFFNAPWLVGISALLFLVSQATIGSILHPIGAATLLKVQTTFFSAQDYLAFFAELRQQELLQHYANHLVVDAWHPLWYGLFGVSLLAVLMQRLNLADCNNGLLALPVLAACCDVIENHIQLVFLTGDTQITNALVILSTTSSLIKWVAVLGFLLPSIYWLVQLGLRRVATDHNG